MRRIFAPIAAATMILALAGCDWIMPSNFPGFETPGAAVQDGRRGSGDIATTYVRGESTMPLENDSLRVTFNGITALKGAAVRERYQGMDYDDLLWAISDCQCAPKWTHRVLFRTMETYGALPQVLVPQIREAILKDKRIQAVLHLPGGADGVISKIFASDAQLESTIRSNLLSMVQTAWQSPLRVGASQRIYFDGFSPLPWRRPAMSAGSQVRPDGMDVGSTASRWLLVSAAKPPWSIGPGKSRGDLPLEQDIQLISWARMMAEINYILGVKRGFDGRIYGGLMVNPHDPSGNLLGFEMLPATGAPNLALSGQIRVAYQPLSSLKLIVNGREKWQRQSGSVDLAEQARVWRAGAAIFKGLRLDSRKFPAAIFGGGDANLFPADAQRLGLAFLQGMDVLLGDEFIALDSMTIGDSWSIPEQRVQRSETDIVSMVRVANSLAAWVQEIQSIESSGLSEADKSTLRESLPKLQDALRLSTLRALRRSTDWLAFESGDAQLAISRQAELIATIGKIEQEILRSGFVRRRIAVDGQKLIDNLAARLGSTGILDLTPEEAIWCREALERLKSYSNNEAEISALIQSIDSGIRAWDAAASI